MTCFVDYPSLAQSCRHTPCAVGRGTSSPPAVLIVAALLAFSSVCASILQAHDGPEHVIEALSETIERTGPTPELLYRRAIEYRAMRDYRRAADDLRQSIAFNARHGFPAECELVRVLVNIGDAAAQREARVLLDSMWKRRHAEQSPEVRCELAALSAQIHYANEAWDEAIGGFNEALRHRDELSWYVLRSRAQSHYPGYREVRERDLRLAYEKMQSPVIRQELCEALLEQALNDDEKRQAAVVELESIIAEELQLNRYRSAWLILRSRLFGLQNRLDAERADLREALAELQTRVHLEHPDPVLLLRRSYCHAVLLDIPAARADLTRARRAHAPDWMLEPLETIEKLNVPTFVSPDD